MTRTTERRRDPGGRGGSGRAGGGKQRREAPGGTEAAGGAIEALAMRPGAKAADSALVVRGVVDAEAAPLEPHADDRLVERAVEHLRRLVIGGQVEIMIQVGEYLIENFYGGIEEATSR